MERLANDLLIKTQKAKDRFVFLTEEISKPEVISDNKEWKKLVKERSMLEDIASAHDELEKLVLDHEACQKDYDNETSPELRDMFYEEIGSLREKIEEKAEEVKFSFFLKTKMMTTMLLLKLGRRRAERSPLCLQACL